MVRGRRGKMIKRKREGCLPSTSHCLVWENWDRLQKCRPAKYHLPQSEEEVVSIVRASQKRPLKVVGAGHSFSSIALCSSNSDIISLDRMSSVVKADGVFVTVQAGIRLYELNAALEKMNLSLENTGATCEQSLAGATATGTHGTGRLLGSM